MRSGYLLAMILVGVGLMFTESLSLKDKLVPQGGMISWIPTSTPLLSQPWASAVVYVISCILIVLGLTYNGPLKNKKYNR